MTSMDLKTEPLEEPMGYLSLHQVCRLCLSEECLVDVFEEEFLNQWVVDFLSITISKEDRMSIFVCAICRIRLTEFHQFRIRCQEVQDVLKSMIQSRFNDDIENAEQERCDSPIQCKICSKFFNTKQQLYAHKRIHGVRKHKCTYCEKAFAIRQHFDKHMKTHAKPMNNIQNTTTPNEMSMVGLSLDIKTEPYEESVPLTAEQEDVKKLETITTDCQLIESRTSVTIDDAQDRMHIGINKEQTIDTVVGLSLDIKTEHYEESASSIAEQEEANKLKTITTNCKPMESRTSVLNKDVQYTQHIELHREHNQLIPCSICHKPLQSKQALWHHKRKVHGPKNFECAICNVGFPFLNNLKAHMSTNTHKNRIKLQGEDCVILNKGDPRDKEQDKNNEKKHECPDCNRKFEQKSQLERHIKTHKSGKYRECDICSKLFANGRKLWLHKKYHGPKNYSCPICERPFTDPSMLRKHIPTHEPNRVPQRAKQVTLGRNETGPYKCDICHKGFRIKYAVNVHKKRVHGPKKHKCHMCEHTFATRASMLQHIRREYRKNDRGLQSLHTTQRIESPRDETIETTIDSIAVLQQKPDLPPTDPLLN